VRTAFDPGGDEQLPPEVLATHTVESEDSACNFDTTPRLADYITAGIEAHFTTAANLEKADANDDEPSASKCQQQPVVYAQLPL
jgi:hypothetical protein